MQKAEKQPSSLPSPSRFLGLIILWLFFGLIFLLYTLHNYSVLDNALNNKNTLYDFKLFYAGNLDFLSGGSLYKASADLPFERNNSSNNLSPIGALLVFPFSQLPFKLAATVWNVLSLVFLYWGVWYIWRCYPVTSRLHWQIGIILFIYISYPVVDALQLGTWGMFIAFLDFAAWYFARRGNDKLAGILLGLALALRWQPFVIFLYFLIQRRWKIIFSSIATVIIGCLIALPLYGLQTFVEFSRIVFSISGEGSGKDPYDGSLRAFLARIFDVLASQGLNLNPYLGLIWLVISLGLLSLTLWRCNQLTFDYAYSLCIVAGLILTPLSWFHYHMALVLPLILLFAQRKYWSVTYIALLWLCINFLLPIDFESNPLFYGTSLSLGLFILYFAIYFGPDVRNQVSDNKILLFNQRS